MMSEPIEVGDPLLVASEVADILRVDPAWIYRAARRGEIRSVKIGRHVRFRPEDIRELRNHGIEYVDNS
jgi:excisionase family DNA binding protein